MTETSGRVLVLGLRGIPGVQGGVESHAEKLYPRIVREGWDVVIVARSPYLAPDAPREHRGVRLARVWSPTRSGMEAMVHSVLAVLYAGVRRPDVVHVHAVGPGLVIPLARALGLRTVFTHHGFDYEREKWGAFARWLLRLGERLASRWATRRIAISEVIARDVEQHWGRAYRVIPNGADVVAPRTSRDALDEFDLETGRYVLMVGRFVPEKRHLDLVRGFERAALDGWKLVLVGGLEPESEYVRTVEAAARDRGWVVLTGYQGGERLAGLYDNAGVFALPSSHEGLPIALLEALQYGLRCVASDIPANRAVEVSQVGYYPVGDVAAIAESLREAAGRPWGESERAHTRAEVTSRYDWDAIARDTAEVYRGAMGTDDDA